MLPRRIRRTKRIDYTAEIEELMKSIATAQSLIAQHTANITRDTAELYALMKAQNITDHRVEDITAELVRSAGKATNIVDPRGFRRLVKDDKEFYSAISVSITAAKKVLPEKQLLTITTKIPGTPGEEVVRVKRG